LFVARDSRFEQERVAGAADRYDALAEATETRRRSDQILEGVPATTVPREGRDGMPALGERESEANRSRSRKAWEQEDVSSRDESEAIVQLSERLAREARVIVPLPQGRIDRVLHVNGIGQRTGDPDPHDVDRP